MFISHGKLVALKAELFVYLFLRLCFWTKNMKKFEKISIFLSIFCGVAAFSRLKDPILFFDEKIEEIMENIPELIQDAIEETEAVARKKVAKKITQGWSIVIASG